MKTTTVADAKARLAAMLTEVSTGEEIVITRRGKPVARLIPEPPEKPFDWSGLRRWVAAAPPAKGVAVEEMRRQDLL